MSGKNNNWPLILGAAVLALGLGYAVGSAMAKKSAGTSSSGLSSEQAKAIGAKNLEELGAELSDVMLPLEEYNKLGNAIQQTAMGLMMAQGSELSPEKTKQAEDELKKEIDQKYSRKYFTDMNSSSMKELSKEDLVAILSFYATDAGKKFLVVSPKIIETTMTTVQADLAQWLPKTVDGILAKVKGGAAVANPEAAAAPEADKKADDKPSEEPRS